MAKPTAENSDGYPAGSRTERPHDPKAWQTESRDVVTPKSEGKPLPSGIEGIGTGKGHR